MLVQAVDRAKESGVGRLRLTETAHQEVTRSEGLVKNQLVAGWRVARAVLEARLRPNADGDDDGVIFVGHLRLFNAALGAVTPGASLLHYDDC
ncbi:MAG TPA: hypothetical protein VGC03_09270 [Acidimicrobiia bacterium]